jgi:transcriptional regulator with XRE-family HTH domain
MSNREADVAKAPNVLGRRIAELRGMRHMTQHQLAVAAGLGGANKVSDIETGAVWPKRATLLRIVRGLDVDFEDLFQQPTSRSA